VIRPDAGTAREGAVGLTRIWNRAFIAIFVTNALVSIGLQMVNVLVGKYTNSLGATAALVGTVSSAFAWAAIIFKIFSGPALDALNRKRVVMWAMVAIAIAFFGFGISASVPELLVFRFVQGAGQAFTTTAFVAMAADALPKDKTSTGLGFYALAAGIAQMVGPVISLNVAESVSYRAAFFIAGAFLVLALLAATQIRLDYRKTKKFEIKVRNIIAPEVLLPALIMVLVFSCYSLINPFLPLQGEQVGVGASISYYFTIYAAVLFISRPLSGWLADRFGYIVLVPMFVLFIGGFWLVSAANSLWMFLLAAVVIGFGYGGCQPVMQSLAMRLVPKERRGAASSTNFIGSDLGNIIGPIVGGSIADSMGYSSMWQIMTITLVVSAILVVVFRGHFARGIVKASEAVA
jgi:MFS family permease